MGVPLTRLLRAPDDGLAKWRRHPRSLESLASMLHGSASHADNDRNKWRAATVARKYGTLIYPSHPLEISLCSSYAPLYNRNAPQIRSGHRRYRVTYFANGDSWADMMSSSAYSGDRGRSYLSPVIEEPPKALA